MDQSNHIRVPSTYVFGRNSGVSARGIVGGSQHIRLTRKKMHETMEKHSENAILTHTLH